MFDLFVRLPGRRRTLRGVGTLLSVGIGEPPIA
jgi:hypothetical protein